jgi:hypothetical protein
MWDSLAMPMSDSPATGDEPPLRQIALAYGVRKKGWDQLKGVATAIQSELQATAWAELPEDLSGRRGVTRLVKDNAISQVIGTMVVNIDREGFAAFRRGQPLDGELRTMIDSMVEAAAFREGGAAEFVDLVLDNIKSHLVSGD